MDPFFRPILLASLFTILLNTVFIIPIMGMPVLTFFLGGVLASYFHRKEYDGDEYREIKVSDATILGLGTGILVGAVLSFILSYKLQDPEIQRTMIDAINERMRMRSEGEFQFIESFGSIFYVVTGATTIFFVSLISLFGSIAALAFLNKGKK